MLLCFRHCLAICLAFCVAGRVAQTSADEPEFERLYLQSGEVLTGRSVETRDGWMTWETETGERLPIPLDQIDRLETGPEDSPPEVPPAPALTDPDSVLAETAELKWTERIPLYSPVEGLMGNVGETAARWTQRLQIGATFNDGNTQTDLIDVVGVLERNTKEQMRQIDIGGQWGRNQGNQTANRWWLNSNFDWPVYDKWIAFTTSKNETNQPANLNYRGTLSAGGGYRFFFEDKRRLIVRFGPAYTVEFFRNPDNMRESPDLFGEMEIRWPMWERTSLEQKMRVQPSLLDFRLVRVFSNTGVLVDIDEKDRWKLRLGFQYQYNSEPNPGRVPADYLTTVSLVYVRK